MATMQSLKRAVWRSALKRRRGLPPADRPWGPGALRQATAQQLLCAQWPLLFSPHRRWWQQQQVPIGWSPSHHRQKSHLVGALCPLSATNIHNAMTTATWSNKEISKFWLKHMRTGFNACIVLRFYLFRMKNISKQFYPQEEAGVCFICVEICLFQSCFVVPVGLNRWLK